eukprot:Colp12_sorted_trinity150504_noHs@26416
MLPRILHHLPSSTVLRAFAAHKMCGSLVQSVLVVHLPRSLLSSLRLHQTSVVLLRPLATFRNRPSLAACAAEFPEVIRQWHPHKNTVGPESVTPGSAKKIWFMCDEGHEWEAILLNRTRGNGCPTCNRKKVTSTNTLLAKHPEVAAEWHPTKNGELTPKVVAGASATKVWWQCKE